MLAHSFKIIALVFFCYQKAVGIRFISFQEKAEKLKVQEFVRFTKDELLHNLALLESGVCQRRI